MKYPLTANFLGWMLFRREVVGRGRAVGRRRRVRGDATIRNADGRDSLCAILGRRHAAVSSLRVEQAKAVSAVLDVRALKVNEGYLADLEEELFSDLLRYGRDLVHGEQEGRQPNGGLAMDHEEVVDNA